MKAIAACLCGLLLAAGGAEAANTSLLNPQQRADAWAAALRGIDAQLRRAEFGPARENAVDWVRDMVRYMGAGGQSAYTLAVEPAKLQGKPVAVTYSLTVDFKVRR